MSTTHDKKPSRDVGTEVLFENDVIRIWNMELQPGEASHYHRHGYDYFYVYTTPSRIAVHRIGEPDVVQNYQANFVQYNVIGDGIEHSITNVGEARHQQIIVELKRKSASDVPLPPENNNRFD